MMIVLDVIIMSSYILNSGKIASGSGINESIKVFNGQNLYENNNVSLILLGDVMLGRTVNSKSSDMRNPKYPFEKVADRLKSADIVYANLESPFFTDCPRIEDGYVFCAGPEMVQGLVFSGVDVVNLANNHNLNFGEKGVADTINLLDSKGIKWTGKGNLAVIEKRGVKFGFLGFDFVSRYPGRKDWDLIKVSDSKVDILVVGAHWGEEYKANANSFQQEWAKEMIENGADIIAGHHSHLVQNDEIINGKNVYYSLGNFVFDQMWSEETKIGLAVELTFKGVDVVSEEKLPVYMKEWAQPEWVVSIK